MFVRSRLDGSKVIRAVLNGEIVWRGYRYLYDDFSGPSLKTSLWDIFGGTFGTVTIVNGECHIENTTGVSKDNLGISSKLAFPVGTTYRVRSKNPQGRHASLIGFGNSPFTAYPHGAAGVGITRYSRADVPNSVALSVEDDTNTNRYIDNVGETEDSRDYAIYEMVRVSETVVELYRNGVLEATAANVVFANDYPIFLAADGWSNANQSTTTKIVIDWVEVIGPLE